MHPNRVRFKPSLVLLASTMFAGAALADEALVAVATNFAEVMEPIEVAFEAQGEHTIRFTTGSTGILYAQIKSGAPFDILLAADQRRPELLEREGLVVPGSRFTYATGRLTLWSPKDDGLPADGTDWLRSDKVRKIAMANPRVAPYGAAAMETLQSLNLAEALSPRLVMGENIGQAYAMVATGNAELGFMALSYVLSPKREMTGKRWDVPEDLYSPIRQDAVLLARAAENSAALAFVRFLASPVAQEIIERYGYAPTR